MSDVTELIFAVPPKQEQHRIVTKVDELMALCDTLKTNLQNAQTTQLALADVLVERPPVMIEVTFADARAVDRGQSVRAEELADLRRLMTMYATVLDVERADQSDAIRVDQFEVTAGQHELLFI